CFGGVSLAIYIHGSSKEILKLVRASKAFHSDPDINAPSRKKYIYPNKNLTDKPDTELVYFDILKALSPELDLRVIVDVIAGASAGGMNSIFLGRALAHDLSMDHLRHHWLEEADVSKLVGDKKPPGPLDKILSKPLINYLSRKYLGNTALADRVQKKLPALMNIWKLKPPFDGKHFLGIMYKGLDEMDDITGHSLMPYSHRLDLYITVTDYYGFSRVVPLYDPPVIHEREHRHNFHFSYLYKKNGSTDGDAADKSHNVKSDFKDLDIPALSFAARATSSYPGAFPPAQLREMDSFMKDTDRSWVKKDDFLKKNFSEYEKAGLDPMMTSFLDGSILNNKPFDQAINAIQGRPAFREVDRRIIYIDPNPEKMHVSPTGAPPSMLNTIKGAMSDIPMNEPMHDDLTNIQIYNQQIRTIKNVIDHAKPEIEQLVTEISGKTLDSISQAEDITYLRIIANIKSVTGAGFSYGGYARLKVRNTVANLTNLIADICGLNTGSTERRRLFTVLHHIAFRDKFDFSAYSEQLERHNQSKIINWVKGFIKNNATTEPLPSWGYFLTKFDIKYQRRRLLFVIKGLNTHYSHHPGDARKLDKLKRSLYDLLENISNCATPDAIPDSLKKTLRKAFCPISQLDINDDMATEDLGEILKEHQYGLDSALKNLADMLHLDQYKAISDKLIAEQNNIDWESDMARNLAISYIGFSFWDVTTFSVMGSKELGEFNEIKINRISPKDVSVLRDESDDMPLRGTAMAGFGAFFSRTDRENDYLWGRFNSAERLIDLLYNQAEISNLGHKMDVVALKKRAFTAILDVEEEYLQEIPALFTELRDKVNKL
ncbi:MAG: patatin-like protein, partial [Emcibacter sp.]|nr:patatin-like protein [Emcibacter sp.]